MDPARASYIALRALFYATARMELEELLSFAVRAAIGGNYDDAAAALAAAYARIRCTGRDYGRAQCIADALTEFLIEGRSDAINAVLREAAGLLLEKRAETLGVKSVDQQ